MLSLRVPPLRRLAAPLLLWLGGLALFAAVLQRPAPLLVNLGAGDAPFARGFRPGWERDGVSQAGATMFHWTLDGARLEVPVRVLSGSPVLRIRCARFVEPETPISLLAGASAGGGVVDRWSQPARGWRVREVELGPLRGPLSLQFRSPLAPDGLGVAVDWVQLEGVGRLAPGALLWPGLLAWLLGLPVLTALLLDERWLGPAALAATLAGSLAVLLDRFGGLVAVSAAGVPACLALVLLALLARGLSRLGRPLRPGHAAAAIATAAVGLLALSHPFFHYPDVDTHSAFVRALSADPGLALDPAPFQERTGAWTRDVAGRRVGFPYSPVFHLLAVPLAPLLGYERAVETSGVVALGATSLLVAALALALGQGAGVAATAQGLLALLPASASRLSLALFPALLGQAAELSLALGLALRLAPTSPAGRVWVALLLVGMQAAYIGSSLTVPALVGAWALLEGGRRGWREVAGVLLATLAAGAAVVLVLYGHFLPTLLREVLPHAGGGGAPGGGLGEAGTRLLLFFGPAGLGLGLLGVALLRGAPDGPRSAHRALLLAGAVLLGMRYLAPALFRDVKEVELLTPPVAIAAAVALHWLGRQGGAGRVAAVAGLGGLVWWGALEAGRVYAGRFLAVGL